MRSPLGLVVLLPLFLTTSLAASPPSLDLDLVARALNYEDEVCHPVTQHASDTVPPCLELVTIETTCTPNGTSPLALKAHQDCMCRGSFFSEWPFCLQCLFIHGLRSERDVAYYKDVLSTASSALCGVPTPTAEFASIFSSAQNTVPVPTTGDTVSSDQAVSQTAVSLYYTATGYQGPGQITGAATAATASVLFTAPRVTPPVPGTTGSGIGGVGGSPSTTASGTGAKPSQSGSGAAAIGVEGVNMLVVAVVALVSAAVV